MDKIKMYLSARIAEEQHDWNNEICGHLCDQFEIFKPQEHNPWNLDHRKFEKAVYEMDLQAMIESEIGILLTPYGRDCAWEVGWYAGSEKPIVLYTDTDLTWTRDWMVKGGIDAVFVHNEETFSILSKDKIVHDKVHRIPSKEHLGDAVAQFLSSYKNKTAFQYAQVAY